jgi:hypothetical protein
MAIENGMQDVRVGLQLIEEAYMNGRSISAQLERDDPSDKYRGTQFEDTDAFQRQLVLAGIKPASDLVRGIRASQVQDFWDSDYEGSEYLFPEWMSRVWRRTTYRKSNPFEEMAALMTQRGADTINKRFYASSSPVSDVLKPDYIQTAVRQKQLQPPIPLNRLVAITTPIDSDIYKAFYLTDDEDERQMKYVTEGSALPTAKLTGSDHTINLYKYGRRLLVTYESMRRMTLDRFALHIGLLALQAEIDKVAQVIDVLVNGDGNSNSATNTDLTTADSGTTANNPTAKAYLYWRTLWEAPYNADVILANRSEFLDLLLLDVGSANVTLGQMAGTFGIGGIRPLNAQIGPVEVGYTDDAPANKWMGIDTRFACEQVVEIGADITETNRIISRQFEEITLSETVGYAVMDSRATRTLDLSS